MCIIPDWPSHSRTETVISESPWNIFNNSHVETRKSIQPKWNVPFKKLIQYFKLFSVLSQSESFMHVSCLHIWYVTNFQNERCSVHIIYTFKKNLSEYVVIRKTFSKHCWKTPQCPLKLIWIFFFSSFAEVLKNII